MKMLFYLTLVLTLGKPGLGQTRRNAVPPKHRYARQTQIYPTDPHWCEQPTRKLRWLSQMIQNAQAWPPYHYGWEVHQARLGGYEVFVLHLCRYCGSSRGFLLYNHHGQLIDQGEGADSIRLADMSQDRLLAANAGRFTVER